VQALHRAIGGDTLALVIRFEYERIEGDQAMNDNNPVAVAVKSEVEAKEVDPLLAEIVSASPIPSK
jgi:hypothetical protein